MTFEDEVSRFLNDHPETEMVDVLLGDINGIFRGKQYPVKCLTDLATKGVLFPYTTPFLSLNGENAETIDDDFGSDPDRVCYPVPGTLTVVPWALRPSAQVIVEMRDPDGSALSVDPRAVLARVLDRYRADGLRPIVALEYEFYLFEPGQVPPVPVKPANGMMSVQGGNAFNLDVSRDYDDIINEIRLTCLEQGIDVTNVILEYGTGQFEVNFGHTEDVMRACDDAMLMKRAVRNVALKHGLLASFMAKPVADDMGSGMHLHASLLNAEGANIFGIEGGEARLEQAIGGLLASMPDATAIFAPNANSFRRFDVSCFAPVVPCWGENNRRLSVRIPLSGDEDRRFEHRVCGADVCPHLAAAAILAGAHYGLQNHMDAGPKMGEFDHVDQSNMLPSRWRQALAILASSDVMKDYLGEGFVDIYTRVRSWEENGHHRKMVSSDYDEYLRIL